MNFLHLAQRWAPAIGGSEWYMTKIAEGAAGLGHRSRVITTTAIEVDALWRYDAQRTTPGVESRNGVEVIRLPERYFPVHGITMRLLSMLPLPNARYKYSMPGPLLPPLKKIVEAAGDFDLVHATALPFTSILWAGRQLAESKGVPFVITPFMHFGIEDRIGYGYRKKYQIDLLSSADALIAVTEMERNGLIQLGIDSKKIKPIKLGIDAEAAARGDGEAFRKKYNLHNPIVFNVSGRTFDKGAQHTVEAMRVLWERGINADLVMAGAARRDFVDYLKSLPGRDRERILELGVVDEKTKSDIFAAGDVFCMPSRAESFGLVFLEAWNCGAAVVAAASGAAQEVVRDGIDGILAPFGDVKAIAGAIEKLITDKPKAVSMAAAGRKRIEDELNWKRTFEMYCEVIRELTGVDL